MEVGSTSAPDSVIETLRSRGWCFGDLDQLNAIIMIQSALADDLTTTSLVDSVESELANMDLKSIGGKSLPDPSISSARDISRSSIEEDVYAGGRRLLRLTLTDGFVEITAIEYLHVPSIPDDVVPGTKVCLKNKAAIHSGIVCLNPKVLTVIGGVVPSLYEEWQMNKKYSGFSRSSLRLSKESDGTGPPSFEKLQIGVSRHLVVRQDYAGLNSKNGGPAAVKRYPEIRPTGGNDNLRLKANGMDDHKKSASLAERPEEKPSSSETRPKEVAEFVPVQNQAAAQKLLQKLNNQNPNDRHYKGRQYKWKEKREEPLTLTLDEWEKRKAGAKPLIGYEHQNISHDEDLAWQLQNQFDLEDTNVSILAS
ncbi:RecQ mediated genome instability protein, N-terminal [Parasponia andersonii]|uniref:RecQ mediated genome instability protein, N-terminal n=1 Tax=Parasponia andersonii TaxID=3476 RepID=A0A2P5DJC3_PARAD|nr:RecQ mediated genome instability protein, N-terminal [Parasponia andersonii]